MPTNTVPSGIVAKRDEYLISRLFISASGE